MKCEINATKGITPLLFKGCLLTKQRHKINNITSTTSEMDSKITFSLSRLPENEIKHPGVA